MHAELANAVAHHTELACSACNRMLYDPTTLQQGL
jgi:hypothetical protein